MQRLKSYWQESAGEFKDLIPDTNRVRAETKGAVVGASAEAIDAEFAKLFDGDYSLDKLAQAMDAIGEMAGSHGTEIQYTKLMVISTLAIAAVQIYMAIAEAPETFGGSLAEIPIVEAFTSMTIREFMSFLLKQILETAAKALTKTAVKRLIKSVGIQLAIAEGQDFGIQTLQNALGTRHGYDVNKLIDTAVASTVGAGAAHMLAPGLSRLIPAGETRLGRMASNALQGYATGVGGNIAGTAALMTYRDGVHFDAASIFGGAASSGLMHRSVDGYVQRTGSGGVESPIASREPAAVTSSSDRVPVEATPSSGSENGSTPTSFNSEPAVHSSPESHSSDTTAASHTDPGGGNGPADRPTNQHGDSAPTAKDPAAQPTQNGPLQQDSTPRQASPQNAAGPAPAASTTTATNNGAASAGTTSAHQSPTTTTSSTQSQASPAGTSSASHPSATAGVKDSAVPAAKSSATPQDAIPRARVSDAVPTDTPPNSHAAQPGDEARSHTAESSDPAVVDDRPITPTDAHPVPESTRGQHDPVDAVPAEPVSFETEHHVPDVQGPIHEVPPTQYPGPNECARQTIEGFQHRHPDTTVHQVSDHGGEGTDRVEYEQALGTSLREATPADVIAATRDGRSVIVVDTYRSEVLADDHPGGHTYSVEPNPHDPDRPLVFDGDKPPHPWPPRDLQYVAHMEIAEFHPDGTPAHSIPSGEHPTHGAQPHADDLGARPKNYMIDDGPGDPVSSREVRPGVHENRYEWDSHLGEPGVPRDQVLGHPDTTVVHRTRIERDFEIGSHSEFPGAAVREVEVTVGKNTAVFTVVDGHPARADFLHREVFDPLPERPSSETNAQANVSAGHPGDDAGHMSAFRFTLDQEFANLFPQEGNFNKGAYKTLENEWGEFILQGGEVYARIDLIPPDERPDQVVVQYAVNRAGTDQEIYFNEQDFDNASGQAFQRLSKNEIIKLLKANGN